MLIFSCNKSPQYVVGKLNALPRPCLFGTVFCLLQRVGG